MRVIFLGTGEFAVPSLHAIAASTHRVLGVISKEPPPAKTRGKQLENSPVQRAAQALGLPVFLPQNINSHTGVALLEALNADILVVCDYGQILKPRTLETAPLGGLNLHGSLLPKYRGAAPVAWAILHGEPETGVSVIQMTPQLDAGPVLAQAQTQIEPDESCGALEARLALIGAPLVLHTLTAIQQGTARPLPQSAAAASTARRLIKADGAIHWQTPASQIKRMVQAFDPWPRAFTNWHRPGLEPLRLILGEVTVEDTADPMANGTHAHPQKPGTVVSASPSGLTIATAQGLLKIHSLQPAGKRLLTTAEFLRGYPVREGGCFGDAG